MGVLIDSFDIESNLNAVVRDGVQGWKDGFSGSSPTAKLALREGVQELSKRRNIRERTITLPLFIEGSSESAVKSNLDELKFRLNAEDITVELPDENREFTAETTGVTTTGVQPDFATVAYNVDVVLRLTDPRLFSTSSTSIDFSGSATETTLGTARVWPVITVEEVTAPYTITYKDSGGNTVASITLDTTLGAGEQRIIDMDKFTIEDSGGTNQISEKSGGEFFALDPQDGSFGGPYPTLEIDSTATIAKADYNEAYI